jgi:hypothetical protein
MSSVPQGSVLGLFIFTVFVDDPCNSVNYWKLLIFADDLKILCVMIASYFILTLIP